MSAAATMLVQASDLRPGHHVIEPDGALLTVERVEHEPSRGLLPGRMHVHFAASGILGPAEWRGCASRLVRVMA